MQKSQPKNPLSGLMRRPKLKIKLPSNGLFWKEGCVELSETNEYDVYSLTARDEIMLKNPATIASGQPIVNAIQSCIPAIKNASDAPNIDVDALLVAIRIASQGNMIKATVEIEDEVFNCDVDLYKVLEQINNLPEWDSVFKIDDDVTVYIQPVPFSTLSALGMEAVETQKIMSIINDEQADENKKIEVFKKSFSKLTNLTMGFVQQCVYRIDVGDQAVVNPVYIKDFLENCDSDVFTKIKNRIDELTEIHSIKPVVIAATEEMIAAGSKPEVEAIINYDVTQFFTGDDE